VGRPAIVWRAAPYAKDAMNAESPPPSGITAFTAFTASRDQQRESPPNDPSGDVGDAMDAKLPSLHDEQPLVVEFA